uniref:FadR/GntR family transcriptional regulator n=1 Tax=Sphingomonas sp. TaxID=28214 RepID=UPI0025D205E9|nr:GntR family transcriptional regulator [Sphingomonas sp.]
MDSLQTRRIYIHIADQISQLITDGEFPLGSLLPPERDLALRFGVSRSSIREGVHGGDKPGHWIVGRVPMRAV